MGVRSRISELSRAHFFKNMSKNIESHLAEKRVFRLGLWLDWRGKLGLARSFALIFGEE